MADVERARDVLGRGEDVAAREVRFEWPYFLGGEGRNHDIAPDGRFVVIRDSEQGETGVPDIHVVLNWFEELQARMGSD